MKITTPYKDALPPLATEELEALRASIEEAGGVRDACLATEDGRLLDGHNPAPLTFDQVAAELGEETARRLARLTDLVGLDGCPCFEADRLADLLEMLRREGGAS